MQQPGERAEGTADHRGMCGPSQSCSCLGLLESLLHLTNDCSRGIGAMQRAKASTSPSACVSPARAVEGKVDSLSRSDFLHRLSVALATLPQDTVSSETFSSGWIDPGICTSSKLESSEN